jgi:hypothetical protein
MNLSGGDPGGADQFVDIDRTWPKGRHDQFAFALANVGQGLRRPVLIGGGKLDRLGATQDRRKGLDDVAGGCDKARALLQEIIGAGRTRIERAARNGKHLPALLAGEAGGDQGTRSPRTQGR